MLATIPLARRTVMKVHLLLSRRALLATTLALAALGTTTKADDYPTRPVRIIVSVSAGNGPDVIGRIVADHLARVWGQQVVILNQPGAAGAIAMRAAGTSTPDGYTLLLSLFSNYITLPEWKLPFDTAREFVPIGFVSEQPMLVGVTPGLGVNSLPELIAVAKKRPGEINVGVGSQRGFLPHLTAEWLRRATGTNMTIINYPGSAQAITDLIAGRVHVAIENLSVFEGPIAGGTLKPLAVASDRRWPTVPDLPTAAETIPGFVAMGWFALVAPPGTPQAITRKISEDLRMVLGRSDLKQRFLELGSYTRPMSPDELTSFIRSQQEQWRPIVSQVASVPR
jgi:tripartite-type tricarboxylate transporter receptor subunit TctC